MRKSWRVFHVRLLLGRCFQSFVLPVLEYCSAVWYSATNAHLKLLDRVVSGANFLMGVCLSVIMQIVDLWQYYACRTRSGVTRFTLFVVLYLVHISQCGYTLCCDRTSVHLCPSSPQNLAVSPDFYSSVSVSVQRSWWPRIRWCGMARFQGQGNSFLLVYLLAPLLSPTVFFFFHSMGWYRGQGSSDWQCVNRSLPALHANIF